VGHLRRHPQVLGRGLSRATLQRILTSHSLRPHRRKYYLQITDPDFFPKMEHILGLLQNAPDYLFFFDECTCIQACTPVAPDRRTNNSRTRCREAHYRRNGTTDLMAFLRYQDGQVFGRCTPNHDRHRLIEVFRQHVELYPEDAALHYICDNLNTHYHDDFCETVADLSGVKYKELAKGEQRREWLQSEDKRIVVHFVPFHGSWLNLIEIWFGILKKKVLADGWFESVEDLIRAIYDFIDLAWNPLLAHPFDFQYNGEGLHEKAVRRFTSLLDTETDQLNAKFLNKQLALALNLIHGYWDKVDASTWAKLHDLLSGTSPFIGSVLDKDPKATERLHIAQTLATLRDTLGVRIAQSR
jgi:transposase